MRILVALGGNALLRRDQPADAATQQQNTQVAAQGLAAIAGEHELVITHGNGPQVGLLDLALHNALPDRDVVTVITEVVVDARDPAFEAPSKPIGPIYPTEEAARLAAEKGWAMSANGAARRLVPSPEPRAIVELRSLRTLIDAGSLVICAGGGGIPVALDGCGTMRGVEAVVDKDLTAALLARRLDVDLLVMLTDVSAVHLDWGRENECALDTATPAKLREHDFEAGSMGPKVEAACRFVEATGRRAAIGALEDAAAIARGAAGTQIAPALDPRLERARR